MYLKIQHEKEAVVELNNAKDLVTENIDGHEAFDTKPNECAGGNDTSKNTCNSPVAHSSARVDVGYSCNKPIQERLGEQNDSQVNSQTPTLTSTTQSLSAACTDCVSVDVKVVNDENI
ncbi:hypothetical protein J6590_091127 [Homalodisca vitripennis]|nr:hypothetical protein J6590_091127 [Homalodisca vitripennis]